MIIILFCFQLLNLTAQEPIGHTYRLDGDVTSVNTYREEKGGYYQPNVPDYIYEGDIVTSYSLSSSRIVLNEKALIKLGPDTVFEFKKHSLDNNKKTDIFELMSGNVLMAPQITKSTDYRYEIFKSNTSVAAENSEVAMQYSVKDKLITIACFDGHAHVASLKSKKEIVAGEYVQVKNDVISEPLKMSSVNERNILSSFRPNEESTETWYFPRKKPFHLARFSAGFRYYLHEISSTVLYSAEMEYLPLFHLYSGLYLEPYFGISFTSTALSRLFYQTGVRLEYHIVYGLYAGAGVGYSWLSSAPFARGGRDLNANIGYTFEENDKMLSVVDGVRLSYINARAAGIKSDAICVGLILGFGNGAKIN